MSDPRLSNRALQTPPSPIRKLSPLAQKAKAAGKKVYHLNIGQPDIETPAEFFDGLSRFKSKVLAYEDSRGHQALCQAWSDFTNRSIGIKTDASDFLITTGASEALIFIFMICCDPGDEVIIFDPSYANYMGFAAIAGVKLTPILCELDNNFNLPSVAAIESKMTPRTTAILLCNPNNPTGYVYNREQISLLLDICNQHNLFLVADETYREFVYDGRTPLSVLHIAPDNPRVMVVDSLSKRFSLCGARIGCLITKNQEALATTLSLAQARLASPTIEQFAAAYMLQHIDPNYIQKVRKEYQYRRDILMESLAAIPEISVHKPAGAFYALARLPIDDSERFAAFLLNDFHCHGTTTFVAPAGGFYMSIGKGAKKVRLAFVLNAEEIRQAVEVLGCGLKQYLGR